MLTSTKATNLNSESSGRTEKIGWWFRAENVYSEGAFSSVTIKSNFKNHFQCGTLHNKPKVGFTLRALASGYFRCRNLIPLSWVIKVSCFCAKRGQNTASHTSRTDRRSTVLIFPTPGSFNFIFPDAPQRWSVMCCEKWCSLFTYDLIKKIFF